MLLRRITEHVKAQNWTAVGLDFAIVVIGVFVGLQVSNWNDGRLVQIRRVQALETLQTETIENLALLDRRIANDKDRLERNAVLAAAVSTGSLSQTDRPSFETAIAQILYFSGVPIRDGAYRALEQSGDLALLNDHAFLVQLNDLQAGIGWTESQRQSFRRGLSDFAAYWRPYVEHRRTSRPGVTSVSWKLEDLHEDMQARSAIIEVERMHQIFAGYVVRLRDEMAAFCTELQEHTKTECAVNGEN